MTRAPSARRTAQRARRRGEEWVRAHPAGHGGGVPKKLNAAERQRLVELLVAHPQLPLRRVLLLLHEEIGKAPSLVTAHRYLREMGIGRRRPPKPAAPRRSTGKPAYRYRAANRRAGDAAHYPTHLTQAEWLLIESLFSRQGRAGRPSKAGPRATLDALFYMARTGCSWRMLPHDFPPWPTVYSAFRRWTKKGLFEEMNARLGRRWRLVHGRLALPSAAVADTQSVKTTEKGGRAAGTAASA